MTVLAGLDVLWMAHVGWLEVECAAVIGEVFFGEGASSFVIAEGVCAAVGRA